MKSLGEIVLVLDQGTTGSTAAYFDANSLDLVGNLKVEFPQIYPSSGRVEHDPEAIWRSVLAAIQGARERMVARSPAAASARVAAIGITNQRETVVAWNRRTGEVAGNAIVWQDRRTAERCDALKRDPAAAREILQRTGLVCDPYFSASKIEWMRLNLERVKSFEREGTLVFGTIDSYLIYRLTGGAAFVTDHTNASRTMLYNLARGDYDPHLCGLFGVKPHQLPELRPSAGLLGSTKGVAGIPDGVPIMGCLGDQQAALFGHGAVEGKITYGTGAFLLVNTGESQVLSHDGLLTTVAAAIGGRRTFALEGSAFIAGAAVQFMRDNFKWIKDARESEAFALSQPRDEQLIFIPALVGLAAPYWNASAKGALLGLSRGTSQAQIVRAVLESIALQNVQILSLMQAASGKRLSTLGVDGGAATSAMLMQFQSDVARTVLVRPPHTEMTALGAARAALEGLHPGATQPTIAGIDRFSPTMAAEEAAGIVTRWCKAADAINALYS